MSRCKYFLAFGFAPFILTSCGDDEVTGPQPGDEPIVYMASLTGLWYGAMHVIRTGNCTLGGADSTAVPVIFLVYVESDGGITTFAEIQEPILGVENEWTGAIAADLSVGLTSNLRSDCGGSIHTDVRPYSGKVSVLGNEGYRLVVSTEDDVDWCPASNCTFRVRYDLVLFAE